MFKVILGSMKDRFDRIFVTGDVHGEVQDLVYRAKCNNVTENDLIIVLGDCGFEISSYFEEDGKLSERDIKRQLWTKENIPATIFCVQGNHEVPFNEMHGNRIDIFGGSAIESNGIYFALNGEQYLINDKKFLVLGGAYSVDKFYRLRNGYPWWEHEQPTSEEREDILKKIKGKSYDYILSHTCPYDYRPVEAFLSGISQSEIDTSQEEFLQKVHDSVKFKYWYLGHWHIEKQVDKIRFMYQEMEEIK